MKNIQSEIEEAYKLYRQESYAEALIRYQSLAEQGYSNCQTFVGWMYLNGLGAVKDIEIAKSWFIKADYQGEIESTFFLGKISSIEKNYSEAFSYFNRAARENFSPALYRLGLMHKFGKGVALDEDTAFELFSKAKNLGHIFAQREYAVYLIHGKKGNFSRFYGLYLFLMTIFNLFFIYAKDPFSDNLLH